MDLESKVVLVNGGGSEIGLEVATMFCKAGASVIIAETDALAGALAADNLESVGKVHFLDADLTCEPSIKAVIERSIGVYGHIDWLINCSENRWNTPFDKITMDDFRRVVHENLGGAFLFSRHCAGHLSENNGVIVNVAATGSPIAGDEAYFSSKAALTGLTSTLAKSLAGRVNVYCVACGHSDIVDKGKIAQTVFDICTKPHSVADGSTVIADAA